MEIERRYVVVTKDIEGRIRSRISNSGRNGGEDNYTYKTIGGATRRLNTIEKEEKDHIVLSSVFEIKLDLYNEGECDAANRAKRAAKRVW